MKTFTLSAFAILISCQLAFSQVPQKAVVEHFTNTNCSVCASRNPGFYTNLNAQTNVLHLAIHPSSPYPNCLLYQQNAAANDARTNYYGIYGSTPRLVINGTVISASSNYSSSALFNPYLGLTSPASIRIVQEKFSTDSIRSTIIIKTEATNTLGALSLFVSLAEDTVFYTGGNGEPLHFDVFRKSLTSNTGDAVTLPATVGDSVVFTFNSLSNPIWNFSRIFTLAILQETTSKNLVQAEAVPASAGVGTTGINNNNYELYTSVFPNPSHNFITVQLGESESATVSINNLEGKIVMQKLISHIESQIDISALPNATYILSVKTDKGEYSQKIYKQ
ncbi:MAG: T9SS type A sorting domain-containing protein [Nitrosopumilus sp.]|nr:T9SS type A sorting domain-containing protein [Nitrosopumilus sp.]